ncbi:HWE histidine kinase domain-containing protein [uncultured Devosia sp.]|uniref:HWE histidine kinase domain-containing protein n=1 Tax=uncultured Devosia sp. TaxID=211434 RepID=UPI0030EDD4AB|tara:strand:- start:14813 stop:16414 length:1602 start_codon:yes stop_codon:yes gene_type:complete
MLAIAFALAVPVMAFAGLLLVQLQYSNEGALQRRTMREAQTLAASVERQLQDISTTLRLLETAPELQNGDLEAFHQRSQSALAESPLFVLLLREDGQQLLNTRVPFGSALGKSSNMAALAAALETEQNDISDVFFGSVSQKWVFNVTLPLPDTRPDLAALLITQNAEELDRLIVTGGLPPGWSAALVDRSKQVIASGGSVSVPRGERLPFADIMPNSGNGYAEVDSDIVGYAHLNRSGWQALVWGPVATAQATVLDNWGTLIGGGLVMLLLAIALAAFFGRLVRKPIFQLAERAKRMGVGEIVSPVLTPIQEFNDVSVALTNASFERSQSEDRTKLVSNELQHRTKNMITVVMAMVRQTARGHDVPAVYVEAVSGRLQGLADSIDLLAQDKWTGIPLRRLLHSQLDKFAFTPDQIILEGADLLIRPDAVQPLSLAAHELGTNAMKYGALSVPEGKVTIRWQTVVSEDRSVTSIDWQESGGPQVVGPSRKGFGSVVIGPHIASALQGQADLKYTPEGFKWSLVVPFEQVSKPQA